MTESRSLTGIFIFIGILLFAVWLGISIVTDQVETLMYVVAGGTLITCALLGRKIWLLLPFMASLNLMLLIPGKPSTFILAQLLFVAFCVMMFFMRRLPFKIRITEIEIWFVLLSICILQTYLRNPVSINILGGSSVGGRPYVLYGLALISSLILAFLRINSSELRWIIRLSIFAGLMNFIISTIGYFIPRLGVWVGSANLEDLNAGAQQTGQYGIDRASRIGFLGTASRNIALWISAFKSPIRACFHPLWAPLILISLAFAALSGFRNEIGAVGLTYLVGVAYRGGLTSVIIASMTLILGVALLAFVNLATPLPSNIQRSLSFLPGTWDQEHVSDAESSTQWRVDMWEEALLTEYWIKDKWLGDGLGMSREQMDFINSFEGKQISGQAGTGKLTIEQQLMLAAGNYHSGPVSAIRAIGYLGLFIFILAQIRLSVHAHRQIRRARNTVWFPLTLFIGIPLIWSPFFFVFVFGDFPPAIAAFLASGAMVRLLENNLPLPPYTKRRKIIPTVSTLNA